MKNKIKKQMVFHYCNIGSVYLKIYIYENSVLTEEREFNFEKGITAEDFRIAMIGSEIEMSDFHLVLSLDETFSFKFEYSGKMFKNMFISRELKLHFPGYKERYTVINRNESYFISRSVIKVFKAIAHFYKVKILSWDLFGNFLVLNVNHTENSFLGVYIENHCCTLVDCKDTVLRTLREFVFTDLSEVRDEILLLIGKLEFETEKKEFETKIIPLTGDLDLGPLNKLKKENVTENIFSGYVFKR